MSRKTNRITLSALLYFASIFWSQTTPARAEPAAFLHHAWTTENGLPQNDVTLVQTRDGYLWLATHGGLARFDGVKFTVFDTGNTPALRSNRILALCEDAAGDLWIGTQSGGLTRYSQGNFTTYTAKDGLPDESVFNLLADARGNLWASTPKGLARLSAGRFTVYTTRDGLADNKAFIVGAGPDGGPWVSAGGSLMQFQDGRFTAHRAVEGFPADWSRRITGKHVARDGSVWLATTYGLARLENGVFKVLTTEPALGAQGPRSETVVYIYEDRRGHVRFITPAGLARYADGKVVVDAPIPELSRLVVGGTVRAVVEDREGNVWLGTGGKGLHRFKPRQVTAYATDEGLSDSGFIPVTDDGEGGVWLGGAGLFRFRDGKFTRLAFDAAVRSLHRDAAGTLWVGTDGKGLYRVEGGRLVAHHLSNASLAGVAVGAINSDREGHLWVGTGGDEGQEGGLYRLKDGAATLYRTSEGLVSNDVRFIAADRRSALWVGTTGGLSRFQDGRFTNYTTEQGLSNNYVRDVYEDADGALWIGTYGGGLNRLKDGRLARITTREGLFDNVVSRVLEDDRGNLWMSGNRGLFRASRRELNDLADGRLSSVNCISYGVADGMKSNETNGGGQPAGWKARDGSLWFPTITGVVRIVPGDLNPLPPPVHVEQVLVGKSPADPRRPIEVPPGRGDLEIHYTGLSLTAPEKVRFRYKLEGYDANWVEAGGRRVAYYTNAPPGRYVFRVAAANNDGVWSTEEATVAVVVRPPFWRTWWFISCAVAVVGCGAWLLYRRRIARVERARRAQEEFSKQLIASQEGERKRIAAELHDSLGQDLLIIKNRAALGLRLLDDPAKAREQIEQIAGTASQSIRGVRQIAYNLRPYQLDEIGLTQALEELVERVAGSCPVRLSASIDYLDDLFPADSGINLYRIVQEAINNVWKHSEANEARVTVRRLASELEVTVEDDGRGFAADARAADGERPGFGLVGLGERARMLGGRLVVRSSPGRGTTVRLTIRTRGRGHEV
ncbi:MAG TPA: two-component regulator propeller domain-containing protein [Pyrinomonadaceae bacterium]|nr:two-component regulator propeller domain-containing protein [Pyrinomonadaceae bacterium]